MVPVKSLLVLVVALAVSGGAWARGGGHHGGGFHGGGGWHRGGGWHGSPGFRGFGALPHNAWRGTRHYGGHHSWPGRYISRPWFGFYGGAYPYWPTYGYYWPYSSYGLDYNRDIVLAQPKPPVYIEQGSPPSIQALDPEHWQFCANPEGYYPYVKACAGGWQQLDPQPQGQEPGYWYYCGEPAGYYPYVRECKVSWRKIVP